MARESTLQEPSLFSFNDLSGQVSPGTVKVCGFDVDVGIEGVLVEENRATCAMGHVEAIREKLVVNVVVCLLQRNDMPPSCNLFL